MLKVNGPVEQLFNIFKLFPELQESFSPQSFDHFLNQMPSAEHQKIILPNPFFLKKDLTISANNQYFELIDYLLQVKKDVGNQATVINPTSSWFDPVNLKVNAESIKSFNTISNEQNNSVLVLPTLFKEGTSLLKKKKHFFLTLFETLCFGIISNKIDANPNFRVITNGTVTNRKRGQNPLILEVSRFSEDKKVVLKTRIINTDTPDKSIERHFVAFGYAA